ISAGDTLRAVAMSRTRSPFLREGGAVAAMGPKIENPMAGRNRSYEHPPGQCMGCFPQIAQKLFYSASRSDLRTILRDQRETNKISRRRRRSQRPQNAQKLFYSAS